MAFVLNVFSAKHLAKDCQASIKCGKCGNSAHCTAFHIERSPTLLDHGGESYNAKKETPQVDSRCTEICNDSSEAMYLYGKSCAKTILPNIYPKGKPEEKIRTFAIIDDQSNKSLARSEFFDHFNEKSNTIEYTLASCSGKNIQSGRRATGYILESIDETVQLDCPCLIECNQIPNSKQEVATPAVARHYRHLQDLEQYIPKYDSESDTLLLIGRDLIAAHHVLDHRIGKDNEPYAQRLRLGWTIIGETCLGLVHSSDKIIVNKTFILANGRQSHLKPCEYGFKVKETKELNIGSNIFLQTTEDDTPGLSQEDRQFLKIMDSSFEKTSNGNLSAPLPFRKDRPKLPNNYHQARHRAENLAKSLKRDPVKLKHFTEFMNKIFSKNHAEEAPPVKQGEAWYLPIFGVYHPKKPSKIRVVFDSSAKHDGICLNDVLLKGPDLTNNLVGVLLKFRKGQIAAIADVEQMFFNFEVNEEHRDYLRFIWFKDNDIEKPLVEYRMRVHVFGNSPSPSVANYGLRKAVCNHEGKSCDDVCQFVKENFYVDDALVSKENTKDIVNLIKETQDRLMEGGNIRLHKIVSNNTEVVSSFSKKDLAESITEVDFESESSCLQRSLGISWDVVRDIFTCQVSTNEKPYTKRGLLSVINGVFDPLGYAAPVVLGGRLIMRQAVQNNSIDWDDQLPDSMRSEWIKWSQSLKNLELLQISRPFTCLSLGNCSRCELHIFSDASKDAISSVAYIRTYGENGDSQIGFVLGKSKLAPNHGHTIPRLELCAAVLSTELATFIQKQLKIPTNSTYFYTDSQVVLGYIHNEERRFYVYVSNRVDKILKASTKLQWSYVPTEFNPADHGTRPLEAKQLGESEWLKGPSSFLKSCKELERSTFEVVTPEDDKEVRPLVEVMKTSINTKSLGTSRLERFSSWNRLVRAISKLKKRASYCHKAEKDLKETRNDIDFLEESELLILKEAQLETYSKEIVCLQHNKQLPKDSSLISLAPILDSNGLLRLGGRLKNAKLTSGEKMPIIISGRSYIATLIVRHLHQLVHHQGRHYTEGAIRSYGIWLTGGKRLINSILQKCVKCRMLRGKVEHQKMADLPADRLTPSPPFSYVGVDTFGPWSISTRRTRGGVANAKRWAIMFSCLVTRAIHIEIVEEMTSSSFINALRRFTALRGPVKEFRSDQGTNFIGAVNELGLNRVNVDDQEIRTF